MTPVWLLSFISQHYMGKASFLLVLASLVQLYALQDIVTKANVVPIEWSLSLSVAGLLLLVQAALFFMQGIFMHLKNNLTNARMEAAIEERLRESRENSI
jgi:low affinity Fe/Cu permease